jgi:hypothetical protein
MRTKAYSLSSSVYFSGSNQGKQPDTRGIKCLELKYENYPEILNSPASINFATGAMERFYAFHCKGYLSQVRMM